MGYYKGKIGFIRKAVLKLITRAEKVCFCSDFHFLFVLLNRLHFFIYTGMYLPTAFKQRKSIAIGACRRVRTLMEEVIRGKHKKQDCFVNLMTSYSYFCFINNTMNKSTLQLLSGGKKC